MKHLVSTLVVLLIALITTLVYDSKWEKIHEMLINVKSFSYLHDTPLKKLIINDTNGTDEITIRFSFRVNELKNYENIFQTAGGNDGFRMETNEAGTLALLFPADTGLAGIELDSKVKPDTWNDVMVSFDRDKILKIYYNKQIVFNGVRPDIQAKINEIVVGQGFSDERPFLGDLKNFKIVYSTIKIRPHTDFYIGFIQFVLVVSITLLLIKIFMISSYGKIIIERIFISRTAFLVFIGGGVMVLVALNSFYCIIMGAIGYIEYPYTNFLFPPEDRFADLIKIAISFTKPLADVIDLSKISEWPEIFQNYFFHNPYGGIDALERGELSHFMGVSLGHTYGVLNGYIAYTFSPTYLYIFYALLYVFCLGIGIYYMLQRIFVTHVIWVSIVVFIFSYPGLYIFMRGHFFSAFAVIILSIAIISLILKRERISWIAFGIAMNMRPNFILFAPMIYAAIQTPKAMFTYGVKLGVWSATLLILFYWIMCSIYPDYTFAHTLKATQIYNTLYNYGNAGLAFGSSYYGAIYATAKLYGLIPEKITVLGHIMAMISFLPLVIGTLMRRFSAVELTFFLSSFYVLYTPVVGDYQLLVFILPLIVYLVARSHFSEDKAQHIFIIGLSTILLLSPKNYVYIEELKIYSQVFINPIIMLIASGYILWNRMSRKYNTLNQEIYNAIIDC